MNAAATTEGRIRFRNEALKVAEFGYAIRDSLLEAKGVMQVQVNKRVGSILILFDKTKISAEKILNKIAEAIGVDMTKVKAGVNNMNKALTGRKGRRYVKRGLMATITTAIGVVYFSEKLHVVAGIGFLTLLAMHVYQNKRTLMN
jgi:copper chaperone CopZ